MNEYITITEMATRAEITPQAIYKRLNSTLKPYVKTVEKRKYIHIKALEVLKPTTVDNEPTNIKRDSINVEMVEILNKTIDVLQKQLDVKDKQIEELSERLRESHYMTAQNQKQLIEPEPEQQQKSFLKKLFGKK